MCSYSPQKVILAKWKKIEANLRRGLRQGRMVRKIFPTYLRVINVRHAANPDSDYNPVSWYLLYSFATANNDILDDTIAKTSSQ